MPWYALASLSPALLLGLACIRGGGWTVAALLWTSVAVFAMDRLAKVAIPPHEHRTGRPLNVALAAAHFLLLALGVRALSGTVPAGPWQTAALFVGLGLFFGQISNSNAHELIHARARALRRLGAAVFTSLLLGHHVSAHLHVHHVWVATDRDPNTARRGEGFWRFWPRAWAGSFLAGLRAERRRRARRSPSAPIWRHPFVGYVGGAIATLAAAAGIGGPWGVASLLALAIYAQAQLFLSDYVQHYGLRRRLGPDGAPEPVGAAHAWNAAAWYSGAMMLNAPRHSDHHLNPGRAYPALRLDAQTMPMLPSTFPVMGLLATVPPLWRRVMDRRLAALAAPPGGAAGPDLPDSVP